MCCVGLVLFLETCRVIEINGTEMWICTKVRIALKKKVKCNLYKQGILGERKKREKPTRLG